MKTLVAVALSTVVTLVVLGACSSSLAFEPDKDRDACGLIGVVKIDIERSPEVASQDLLQSVGLLVEHDGSTAMREIAEELQEAVLSGDNELRDELVEKIDEDCTPVRLAPVTN